MIELWELQGLDDRRYSTFSWRTRWALKHKGLDFESHLVNQTDKTAIAFSKGTTVPIIRDQNAVVRDSWQIAEYLERSYPDSPSLFGSEHGHALTRFFNLWVNRSLVGPAFAVLACDSILIQNPVDHAYFAGLIKQLTQVAPEELKRKQPENLTQLHKALEPARATLKRQKFIAGLTPGYADYALASIFQWARIVSPLRVLESDPVLSAWFDQMLDLYGGFGRDTPAFY